MVQLRILGSAAGGGFPQWNCNCPNCSGLRQGRIAAAPRTQSSLIVGGVDGRWLLIDASPDIHRQIAGCEALAPTGGLRGSGIAAIAFTDSQIDHTAGLLSLREAGSLVLYGTGNVRQDLTTTFPLLGLLGHYLRVDWRDLGLGVPVSIPEVPDLEITAVPVESRAPPYSTHRQDPRPGDTVALILRDRIGGGAAFYGPGIGRLTDEILVAMAQCSCILVDGTFWTEDEMIRAGIGSKSASSMGHLHLQGPGGMVEALRGLGDRRKILTHINNTNPILDQGSQARRDLDQLGIEVAVDGLAMDL